MVDEGRTRRNPGCIVFSYMIHLFKARDPNNGIEKIPSHLRGSCVLLKGNQAGSCRHIHLPSTCRSEKKKFDQDPTGRRREPKLIPISCLLDSGSGQIPYLNRKKKSYIKTREERQNIIQKTQRKSRLLRKIYYRNERKIQKAGISVGF